MLRLQLCLHSGVTISTHSPGVLTRPGTADLGAVLHAAGVWRVMETEARFKIKRQGGFGMNHYRLLYDSRSQH